MTTPTATGASRPFITDLTDEQRRNYTELTTAITKAIDSGRAVPCLRLPTFFDQNLTKPKLSSRSTETAEERALDAAQRRQLAALRTELCQRCPVLETCAGYAASGVQVYGFLAGTWRGGR